MQPFILITVDDPSLGIYTQTLRHNESLRHNRNHRRHVICLCSFAINCCFNTTLFLPFLMLSAKGNLPTVWRLIRLMVVLMTFTFSCFSSSGQSLSFWFLLCPAFEVVFLDLCIKVILARCPPTGRREASVIFAAPVDSVAFTSDWSTLKINQEVSHLYYKFMI